MDGMEILVAKKRGRKPKGPVAGAEAAPELLNGLAQLIERLWQKPPEKKPDIPVKRGRRR